MKRFLPGLILCVIMQEVLLTPFSLGGIRPDLFLLLVVFLGLRSCEEAATLQGFLIGLCQDALSGGPLGLRAFTYCLLGFLTARLSHGLYTGNLLAQFWLLLGGCAAAGGITLGLLSFFLGPPPLLTSLLWVIAPEALYTAVVGLLLLRLPQVRAAVTRPA
ncbi:MAG TPA: rod shape-determining protein MreD [Candidatus Methylomirabilis sp.]|nr:rod shape-determining protein MreD [Candidatus Methylomirabilis sp.]